MSLALADDLAWGEGIQRLQDEYRFTVRWVASSRHRKRRGRLPVSALEGFWDLQRPTGDNKHVLAYDSVLTVTDGQLDYHCVGCGGWDSDNGWRHPTGGWCTGFYSL